MTHARQPRPRSARTIVVNVPVERAFEVFTAGYETWNPPEHHIGEVGHRRLGHGAARGRPLVRDRRRRQRVRVGPRAGLGAAEPRRAGLAGSAPTGSTTRTRARERGRGALHRDRRRPTRVELEHRHLDRHGEGWERPRDRSPPRRLAGALQLRGRPRRLTRSAPAPPATVAAATLSASTQRVAASRCRSSAAKARRRAAGPPRRRAPAAGSRRAAPALRRPRARRRQRRRTPGRSRRACRAPAPPSRRSARRWDRAAGR